MLNILEYIKKNLVYIIFLLIGMIAIGFVKGTQVVIMLTIFLLSFASCCYMILAIYKYIKGVRDKGIVWWTFISILLCVLVYFIYDSFLLIRILSFAIVISLVMIIYTNLTSKN
jgi:hypothetical protein